MCGIIFFPSHEGYANKNLIKISITKKKLESKCNPFNLLTCLRAIPSGTYVWVDEKKSISEVWIGCQMSLLS